MSNLKISPQQVNPLALQVCQILQDAGFQSFIVGGCVRDLLLGSVPKDWDITANAKPEQVIALFPKTYPTGLQHGTVTVAMGEGVENHFEVTTFRVEGQYIDGRRPEEVFFVNNIEQDLSRRDLTINAIAYDPINDWLVDPFSGISDIQNKIIKAVGNATDRFNEDGLRIMRAARFSARFNYRMDDATEEAMYESIETLYKVSKERIKDELCKILETKHPNIGLKFLYSCRALDFICPYLIENTSYKDLLLQDLCQGELETKIAFLYRGCNSILSIINELTDLKFSNKEIRKVEKLHNLDVHFVFERQNWSVSAYKDFMAYLKIEAGDDWEGTQNQLIKLMEAQGIPISDSFQQFKDEIVFSKKEMNIDGNDLIALGIKPGPQIKNILDQCYQEILHYPEHNFKEYLINMASLLHSA